jgi:hypothetical protein
LKRPVVVGLTGYNLTEIVSGLDVGEQVVMPSERVELTDGLAVTIKR